MNITDLKNRVDELLAEKKLIKKELESFKGEMQEYNMESFDEDNIEEMVKNLKEEIEKNEEKTKKFHTKIESLLEGMEE